MNMTNGIASVSRRWNLLAFVQSSILIVLMAGCALAPPPINGNPSASSTTVTPTSPRQTITVCCSPTPSSISSPISTSIPTSSPTSTSSSGTVLFTANWSAGLNGWGSPDGTIGRSVWSASKGALVCDGSQSGGLGGSLIILERQQLPTTNYAIVARIQVTAIDSNNSGIYFGLLTRESSGGVGYMAGAGGDTSLENVIFEDDAAIKQARSEVPYNDAVGVWHTYRVEAKNNSIKLFIDGTFMFQESVQQNPFLDPGQNGVAGLGCSDLHLLVSSFQVIAL
jgi:hypothetical protein